MGVFSGGRLAMSPTRWQEVERIFNAALDLPAAERAQWIRQSARHDAELIRMVEEMLAADSDADKAAPFDNAIHAAASRLIDGDSPEAPAQLGAYKILRVIGSGGMGTVYLATRADDQFEKRVAIKVLRHFIPSSRDRFLRERQILASMDHPYIARLLDGGTAADGRPYLILDYVEGRPIDEYCRQEPLSVEGICRLFLKVCEAVIYAHQNLIVHRDLKPGNIMVTREGSPKLLDFGIAKLMGDDATSRDPMTQASYGLMTPEYASPEQVRGLPVTTSTDLYSLGAIFFEMLTGKRAREFSTYSAAELVRVVCEDAVPRPSRVSKGRLPVDLDNIVLKALQKEPRDRYSSVEQFAEDVRRYLHHQPVLARHSSLPYRLSKFLKRHWVPAAALTVVTAMLIAGVIHSQRRADEALRLRAAALEQGLRAQAERARAEAAAVEAHTQRAAAQASAKEADGNRHRADLRFEQLRTMIHRFLFDIDKAVEDLPGTSAARRSVANTVLEYLDGMEKDAAARASLSVDLAAAYERVGDLQGSPAKPSLGDSAAALRSYSKALQIRLSLPRTTPEAIQALMVLYRSIGLVHYAMAKSKDAAAALDAGLALREGKYRDHPLVADAAATLHYQRGYINQTVAPSKESLAHFRMAHELFTAAAARRPDDAKVQGDLAVNQNQIGRELCRTGNFSEGLSHIRNADLVLERLNRANAMQMGMKRRWLAVLLNLSENLSLRAAGELRNLDESLAVAEKATNVAKELADADPTNLIGRREHGRTFAALARVHSQRGEYERAVERLAQAVAMVEKLRDEQPADASTLDDLAYFAVETGSAEARLQHRERAVLYLEKGIRAFEGLLRNGSQNRFHQYNIAAARRRLAEVLAEMGNSDRALLELRSGHEIVSRLAGEDASVRMFQAELTRMNSLLNAWSDAGRGVRKKEQ